MKEVNFTSTFARPLPIREEDSGGHVLQDTTSLGYRPVWTSLTEVKYPLLRACSTSAALMAAGKHTHVRTHRTSSDPAYL